MVIIKSIDYPRGCGYKKQGGLYLFSDGLAEICYKLPIPLIVCPACGQGIKPSRGFTWITSEIIEKTICRLKGCKGCIPFDGSVKKFGLIWIGEKYYKTTYDFEVESYKMGVCRRIAFIPKGFEIGKTWVLLAHRKVMAGPDDLIKKEYFPGIFHAFRPDKIEYVVSDTDSKEKLENLEKKGVTLMKYTRAEDLQKSIVESN